MNRNAAIDVSRALAVMLVTLFHVSRGPSLPVYQVGDVNLFGFMANGWVGVGIFFIISGYCMGMSTERDFSGGMTLSNYARYSFKRMLRIIPPYYISIAIWVLIIDVYHIAPKATAFRDIITHVTFTHNLFQDTFFNISGVFWSIGVEMQFYLLLPFIILLCRGTVSFLMVLLVCLGASIATYYSNLGIVYKWGLLNYLVLFVYGWGIYKYKSSLLYFINKTKAIYIATPAFLLLLSVNVESGNQQKMYEMGIAIIYGVIMLKLSDVIPEENRSKLLYVLLLIGQASFSIYLYNYIYHFVMPRTPSPFSIAFMFTGVLGFGVIMYLLVEVNTEKMRAKLFKNKRVPSGARLDGKYSATVTDK
ncbi:acyltransferase family protein [Siccibacter turicensis]|uniref:acyltransferase family protein n=2 Tax=Siccibacter turicensis TaxID=357233 RepID=UPI0004BA2F56|nr:acyltransferase [Siccibacter turicensis]